MDTSTLDTIALIRQIRAKHYQYLRGKTHAERIAFYREQAAKMHKQVVFLWTPETTAQIAQVHNAAVSD